MNQASGEMSGSGGDLEGGDDQEDSSSSPPKSSTVLEEFRKEWKREIENSPQHVASHTQGKSTDSESIPHNVVDKATFYFQLGVENEEKGKMYEAIQFYRRAVQLYPDIEFHLFQTHSQSTFSGEGTINEDNQERYQEEDEENEEDDEFNPETMDLLTHLQFLSLRLQKRSLCFPNVSTNATHFSALPMEVFLYILRWVVSADLDFRSLEMCSRVCRGFYICCRDQEIWRSACSRVWGVKCGTLSTSYSTWRDMYIRRPRLHFSGCYIAKITYIRHGETNFQGEEYRPWHLVEYYRYLRFFPDGRVLMLTSSEAPSGCVGLLRKRIPPARKPPVFSGYYRLHETIVSVVVTAGSEHKGLRPNSNISEPNTFHLELEIRSNKKGLHNQLIWRRYNIFSRHNGAETNSAFELTGQGYPPFRYSRVKSYTADTLTPLCN